MEKWVTSIQTCTVRFPLYCKSKCIKKVLKWQSCHQINFCFSQLIKHSQSTNYFFQLEICRHLPIGIPCVYASIIFKNKKKISKKLNVRQCEIVIALECQRNKWHKSIVYYKSVWRWFWLWFGWWLCEYDPVSDHPHLQIQAQAKRNFIGLQLS